MKAYKEVQRITRDVQRVVCNKCEREMLIHNVCGLEAYVIGCYDSPVLQDSAEYKFDLCEYCLQELMDSFKIPVEKKEIPI